jgi:N-acetylmuramoyl-L-alanine amidase
VTSEIPPGIGVRATCRAVPRGWPDRIWSETNLRRIEDESEKNPRRIRDESEKKKRPFSYQAAQLRKFRYPAPLRGRALPSQRRCRRRSGPRCSDQTDYGNYDLADRPADQNTIDTIVILDTESTAASAISSFQDPSSYTSAHYAIGADGSVTQMVPTKDIA